MVNAWTFHPKKKFFGQIASETDLGPLLTNTQNVGNLDKKTWHFRES